MVTRFWRFLVNIDRAGNNLILNGQLDETISHHAAVAEERGERWACVLCKFLDLFQQDHCQKQLEPTPPGTEDPNA